jgi:hypothetical protein
MTDRPAQLLDFYREHRIDDQVGFYAGRQALFERATGQATALSAGLLGLAAAASALAGTGLRPLWLWSVLATALPAAATALSAYNALYAFEQQSKIYGDAARAVLATGRGTPGPEPGGQQSAEDAAEAVRRVEAVFRQEQAQWGQLTSQIAIRDNTRA